MTHKAELQPFCRYCGKPIPKRTETVWVHNRAPMHETRWVLGPLVSREECQATVNARVVSVSYSHETEDGERTGKRRVRSFNTWDGESYIDEFFCKGACASGFGYMAARHTQLATVSYNAAIARAKARAS